MGDVIYIRACRASQHLAVTRIIIDAANDPSNDAFALPSMQCGIDCRTSSKIGEIRLGEGPPLPIAIDPAKYLLLNGLLHCGAPAPARKNTTFFLQDKGAGGGRGRLIRTDMYTVATAS